MVSIGAVDMVNFGPRATVPERFHDRKFYQHNPATTLMRTTPEENKEIGTRIATRLNSAQGPVEIILPLRGVSLYAKEGGPFHDPASDRSCIAAIKEKIAANANIQVVELDTDINDDTFSRECAERLISLLERTSNTATTTTTTTTRRRR